MSRDINDLNNATYARAVRVLEICKHNNVDMLIYCTLRTLEEQARLYRQGRSYADIVKKMESLSDMGFKVLADVIESVGPQRGSIVTHAAPGESYHNYREAFDAVPIVDGKAKWADINLYALYGSAVRTAGLTWGGDWKFKDKPHAQLRPSGNPLKTMTRDEIHIALNL